MTKLQVDHLSFAYQADQPNVLNQINWVPETGSFNLLIGPSGSGKSTLLKAMAGLLPKFGGVVTAGQVLLNDEPIQPLAPFERANRIAMLFQNPDRQFAMRTARLQLVFALENLQLPTEVINQRVAFAINALHLEQIADQDLLTLSGGEKQRVALAIIFAMDSDIILLDEPFASVDPAARLSLLTDLKKMQLEQHKTIIISDHDLSGYQELVDYLFAIDTDSGTLNQQSLSKLVNLPAQTPFYGVPKTDGHLRWQELTLTVGKSRQLLINSDFTLPTGQIGLLSGANGIGKSTLFKALSHQVKYNGQVTWDDQDTAKIKLKNWAKKVALIFQSASDQFVTMTVQEEVTLSQQHSLATDYWTDERIQTALENLHLNHLTEHVVYQLSGGQQKKLQVLSMLIMGQPILLLDEPLAGLDIDSVNTVMTLINQSIHETDQSVLMISHQRAGLADFIDYELIFKNQQLQLVGEAPNA
ncbi:ABC transporter ATP-binding protein [Weissella thailandensis]|uniref:ABC transporter ATP-binding protein n=1 Tax=Weissella thailandensis TaxID=89061 RepID=A0ABX9I6K5_9LACO|nr:ABC transporter ATP-binding protein [Weissella thailandensis]NKY91502.1 ABC transporter ATP-binding protein [Weissella thailandensis]RDS58961.1 ABC transporter ATP-binding protein [Weissella thailandensis]GEP75129.1 ABC transporter ATP-binding protein [Weissella thailandensis]